MQSRVSTKIPTVILETARRVLQIEADSVREQIGNLGPSFVRAVEEIAACRGRLCVTGLGKSGLIGQKIASTLASTGTPAYFVNGRMLSGARPLGDFAEVIDAELAGR